MNRRNIIKIVVGAIIGFFATNKKSEALNKTELPTDYIQFIHIDFANQYVYVKKDVSPKKPREEHYRFYPFSSGTIDITISAESLPGEKAKAFAFNSHKHKWEELSGTKYHPPMFNQNHRKLNVNRPEHN